LREEEVEVAIQALLAVTETRGHGAVYAALDPARERFLELDEEVQRSGSTAAPRRARSARTIGSALR